MRSADRRFIVALLCFAAVLVALSIPLFLAGSPSYDSDPHVLDVFGGVLLASAALSVVLAGWLHWRAGRTPATRPPAPPAAWRSAPLTAYVTAALLVCLAIVLLVATTLPVVAALLPFVPAALYALKGWVSRRRPA